MNTVAMNKKHTERITEWITGGGYAVAVEVEATIFPDRLGKPYLSPETVRYLEKVEALAEAGDVEALKKAGTVYVRIAEPAVLSTANSDNYGNSAMG
jgi:hypothetical protein